MKNKKQTLKKNSKKNLTSKEMSKIQGEGADDGVIIVPYFR